jgi:hypothetical protein
VIGAYTRGRSHKTWELKLELNNKWPSRASLSLSTLARPTLTLCPPDEDYRGSVGVILFNHSDDDFAVKHGDRIAQLVLEVIRTPEVVQVESLDDTARGEGGFGSTGVSAAAGGGGSGAGSSSSAPAAAAEGAEKKQRTGE